MVHDLAVLPYLCIYIVGRSSTSSTPYCISMASRHSKFIFHLSSDSLMYYQLCYRQESESVYSNIDCKIL